MWMCVIVILVCWYIFPMDRYLWECLCVCGTVGMMTLNLWLLLSLCVTMTASVNALPRIFVYVCLCMKCVYACLSVCVCMLCGCLVLYSPFLFQWGWGAGTPGTFFLLSNGPAIAPVFTPYHTQQTENTCMSLGVCRHWTIFQKWYFRSAQGGCLDDDNEGLEETWDCWTLAASCWSEPSQ